MSTPKLNWLKVTTFPYRYLRFSKNVATRKPHMIKKHVVNFSIQCTPGFVTAVLSDILFEDDHSHFVTHYVASYCINIFVSTTLFTIVNSLSLRGEGEDNI